MRWELISLRYGVLPATKNAMLSKKPSTMQEPIALTDVQALTALDIMYRSAAVLMSPMMSQMERKMSRKKLTAYGCWSNERHINITEKDDAGVIHGYLFETVEAAIDHYKKGNNSLKDDPIVKVTVEIVEGLIDE